jgi:WD40 repeat protein
MQFVLLAETVEDRLNNHPAAPYVFFVVFIVSGIVMVLHGRNAIKTKRIRSKHGKVTKGKAAVTVGKLFVGVGGIMIAAGSLMFLFKGGMLLLSSVGGSQTAQQSVNRNVRPRPTANQNVTQRPTPTVNAANPFDVNSSNDNTGKTGTNANGSVTPPSAVIPTVVKPPATTKLATATDDSLRPVQSMSQEKTVNSLVFSPDGKLLLSADGQRFGSADSDPWHAYIWDVASGQLRQKMDLQNPAVRVRFAPGGRLVAVSDNTGKLTLWEFPSSKLVKVIDMQDLPGHSSGFRYDFDFLGGPSTLILVGQRGAAVVDVQTVKVKKTWENYRQSTYVIDVTKDGTKAITGGSSDEFFVVNLPSGGVNDRFRTPTEQIQSAAISEDGRRAIVRSYRTNISVWDLENRKNLFAIPQSAAMGRAIAISSDGSRVATCMSSPPAVHIWNAETGKATAQFTGHGRAVSAVAISPDGRLAASGDYNGQLQLWEIPVD